MNGRTASPQQQIRDIENSAGPCRPDETERRIAAELKVPVEYFFAYLVVSRALEHYRSVPARAQRRRQGRGGCPADARAAGPLAAAHDAASRAGWLAARIYGACAEGPPDAAAVASDAAGILGAVLLLAEAHHDLDAALTDDPGVS